MRTLAALALDAISPATPQSEREALVFAVPAWQWAGPLWPELARHCGARASVELSPYNSDDAFGIRPEAGLSPRCLERSPDGRGMAWLQSGGPLADYGACSRSRCPRCITPVDRATDSAPVGQEVSDA